MKKKDGAVTRSTIVMDAEERENCRDEREVGSDDIDVPDVRHLQKVRNRTDKSNQ